MPTRLRLRRPITTGMELTIDNLGEVEKFCNGSIRGLLRPIVERQIRIYVGDGEEYANVGDWIVQISDGKFRVVPKESFDILFEKI